MSKQTRHSRNRRPRPPAPRAAPNLGVPPDLYELEKFTHRDLKRWERASHALEEFQLDLYHGLESQRRRNKHELLAKLQSKLAAPLVLRNWVRIVDYYYCLDPLSAAGSLHDIGGRFNIGRDIGHAGFVTWPALYLAEDLETAYREKFQLPSGPTKSGLTPEELALREQNSFLAAKLGGRIDIVLDATDLQALRPFCEVIARFKVPTRARVLARQLGITAPRLVRTASELQRALQSKKWRAIPTQFDLPATSQLFGSFARDAGYEAILYKSSLNGKRCLAVFPEAFLNSESHLELQEPYPGKVAMPRLDQTTCQFLAANLGSKQPA